MSQAGIVVGDGDAAESCGTGGGDEFFGWVGGIRGIPRVNMKVETMKHCGEKVFLFIWEGVEIFHEKINMIPAFKEWALVCECLGDGRQSLLIRKGGIAEGGEGFSFKHKEFYLYPTWFHEQVGRTRLPEGTQVPEEPKEGVEVRYYAVMEWACVVRDEKKLERLREYHVFSDEVVAERFAYDKEPGVHIAFLRVFRLEPVLRLPMDASYGGCKSWIEMPEMEGIAMVSVLSAEENRRRSEELRELLS